MVKVVCRDGEYIEKALKRFKRNCANAGLVKDMRKRTFYEKPTNRRRRRKIERLKTLRKLQAARVRH